MTTFMTIFMGGLTVNHFSLAKNLIKHERRNLSQKERFKLPKTALKIIFATQNGGLRLKAILVDILSAFNGSNTIKEI